MRYASHVADLVGSTPLVRLSSVTGATADRPAIRATVLAKVEYFNPGGSAKDRIARSIIDAAERDGLLRPGGTIVEATSGNTGVGLALIALQRGYRMVFVVPDKFDGPKVATRRAFGAEVVVTPTSVPPEHPSRTTRSPRASPRCTPTSWRGWGRTSCRTRSTDPSSTAMSGSRMRSRSR